MNTKMTEEMTDKMTDKITEEMTTTYDSLEVIAEVMNQHGFRRLFNENFNGLPEIKSVILIMKMYQFIETMYEKVYKTKPDKQVIIQHIRTLIGNSKIRKFFIENSTQMFELDTKSFEEYTQEFKTILNL